MSEVQVPGDNPFMDWIYCESGEAHANQRQRGVAEDPDLSNEADRAGVAGMQ